MMSRPSWPDYMARIINLDGTLYRVRGSMTRDAAGATMGGSIEEVPPQDQRFVVSVAAGECAVCGGTTLSVRTETIEGDAVREHMHRRCERMP